MHCRTALPYGWTKPIPTGLETDPQSIRALGIGTIRHSWDHQEKFHLDRFTWGLLKALLPSCCSHQMWSMAPCHAVGKGWASACSSKRPLQYHLIHCDFLSESCTWARRKCRSNLTWVEWKLRIGNLPPHPERGNYCLKSFFDRPSHPSPLPSKKRKRDNAVFNH